MVICKFYRQGSCRYGQYCQFEHVNNFGNTKTEYNEDDIAVTVVKEVLLAERGGQWLLSCFGPLRDRPCIPGMEDISPDEVRWELYQAQKNGMVEQAKIHFQQLCQDMKAKREALKNPTRETVTMLKKILGSGQKGGLNTNVNISGKSSTFSFAAPQLGLTSSMSNNNVFGNTSFGVQNNNPFGGGGFTSSASSIFGKSTNPVFGGTATFGNNLGVFGNTGISNQANSIFGATSTSTSFSGAQTNTLAFGTSQNNPVFGGPSQSVFGQNNSVFGGTNQLGNNASSTSLFNSPLTSQANTSIFGGATTTTAGLFGGDTSSTGSQANSVFGGVPTTGGIFSQPKTSAFGGTLGFGSGTTSYASTSGNSIFGGSQTFGPAISTSSIFGGSTLTTTPAFGAPVATTAAFDVDQQQSGASTFGTAVSTPNVFGMQNTADAAMNNNPSFGVPATISSPFVTSSQQINSTSTVSTPFANTGLTMANNNNAFATSETSSSSSIFASAATTFATSNATAPKNSPFAASTFANASASPFDSTNANLAGTTLANPFAPRPQQQNDSPFGSVAQNQPGPSNVSSPFGRLFNGPAVDDSVYSAEGALTDEEKEMYLSQRFIIGKIPVKPPTKDIR